MRSRADLANEGLDLSWVLWIRLQAACILAHNNLRKMDDSDNINSEISTLFNNLKKGSKKIRSILQSSTVKSADPSNLQIVTSFELLINADPHPVTYTKLGLGSWSCAALQNNMREFLFKLRNNQLALNNRLNAIDNTVDPRCNFCRVLDPDSNTRENFLHLFFNCPVTGRLLENFASQLDPRENTRDPAFKNIYWYGLKVGVEAFAPQILLMMDCFRFTLWQFKIRKKVPNWPLFSRELLFLIDTTVARNRTLHGLLQRATCIANFLPARG